MVDVARQILKIALALFFLVGLLALMGYGIYAAINPPPTSLPEGAVVGEVSPVQVREADFAYPPGNETYKETIKASLRQTGPFREQFAYRVASTPPHATIFVYMTVLSPEALLAAELLRRQKRVGAKVFAVCPHQEVVSYAQAFATANGLTEFFEVTKGAVGGKRFVAKIDNGKVVPFANGDLIVLTVDDVMEYQKKQLSMVIVDNGESSDKEETLGAFVGGEKHIMRYKPDVLVRLGAGDLPAFMVSAMRYNKAINRDADTSKAKQYLLMHS